jgi:hypothetical protein
MNGWILGLAALVVLTGDGKRAVAGLLHRPTANWGVTEREDGPHHLCGLEAFAQALHDALTCHHGWQSHHDCLPIAEIGNSPIAAGPVPAMRTSADLTGQAPDTAPVDAALQKNGQTSVIVDPTSSGNTLIQPNTSIQSNTPVQSSANSPLAQSLPLGPAGLDPVTAPEPATFTMLGIGIVGILALTWRRTQHSPALPS